MDSTTIKIMAKKFEEQKAEGKISQEQFQNNIFTKIQNLPLQEKKNLMNSSLSDLGEDNIVYVTIRRCVIYDIIDNMVSQRMRLEHMVTTSDTKGASEKSVRRTLQGMEEDQIKEFKNILHNEYQPLIPQNNAAFTQFQGLYKGLLDEIDTTIRDMTASGNLVNSEGNTQDRNSARHLAQDYHAADQIIDDQSGLTPEDEDVRAYTGAFEYYNTETPTNTYENPDEQISDEQNENESENEQNPDEQNNNDQNPEMDNDDVSFCSFSRSSTSSLSCCILCLTYISLSVLYT